MRRLQYAAVLDAQDDVGSAQRAEPMGDHERRAPGHQTLDTSVSVSVLTVIALVGSSGTRIGASGN
jgi:hypothetical protein